MNLNFYEQDAALRKSSSSRNWLMIVILGFSVVFLFLAWPRSKSYEIKQLDNSSAQNEVNSLLARVSELMALPTDEAPTVATVSDPSKLKDRKFFAKAKIGDKVLIYAKAGKAILYNPELNKIVEIAPINIDQQ